MASICLDLNVLRVKKWKDWISDAENKMAFLGMDSDKQKINFIRSCGGPGLTEFWENEAHMSFTNIPADPGRGTAAQAAFLCMQENKHYRCCNGMAL